MVELLRGMKKADLINAPMDIVNSEDIVTLVMTETCCPTQSHGDVGGCAIRCSKVAIDKGRNYGVQSTTVCVLRA